MKTDKNPSPLKNSFLYKIFTNKKRFEQSVFDVFIVSSAQPEKARFKAFIEKIEKIIIIKTLQMFNGSQKDAAKFLGIKYTTLNVKVKKYNIQFQKSPFDPESEPETEVDIP